MVVDEAELAESYARVDGGWIEGVQTLSPRWFAAARYDEQWTRWTTSPETVEREEVYQRIETALGFWDDQFLASVVFAKKLW